MKFNKLAHIARESLENIEVPAVDTAEILEKDTATQIAEMQSEVIEGDQEMISAASDLLEGGGDLQACAETIRVLGARYGVQTLRVSKESIASGVGVASLRKDAARVKAQIALAKEAVGNRLMSAIGNSLKRITGQFSFTEKRLNKVLEKASSLGSSKAKEGKTFDNAQVIDNITSEGKLLEGTTLTSLASNITAMAKAQESAFAAVAVAIKAKNQTAVLDFSKVFPNARNGELDLSGGVYAGGKRAVVFGIEGQGEGAGGILEKFAALSFRIEEAKKTKSGSSGLPILSAAEVHTKVQELKKINEQTARDLARLEDIWKDAVPDNVTKSSSLRILRALIGPAAAGAILLGGVGVVAGVTGAIVGNIIAKVIINYSENSSNNASQDGLGGLSAVQADNAINNFNSVMHDMYKYLCNSWYAASSNLLHYYDWCLSHQAKAETVTA